MIIVRLQGGMGNQMFQYALGRVLSIKNNTELIFNIESYLDKTPRPFKDSMVIRDYALNVFNISSRIASKKEIPFIYRMYGKGRLMIFIDAIRRRILEHRGHEIDFQKFNPKLFELGPNSYIDGFFQSPKYFEEFESVIRKDFTLRQELPENIKILSNEISGNNSLCIHVRRGDFVGNAYHDVVDNQYYKNGIDYISKRTKIDKIYIFSDDIKWCQNNMSFPFETMYVGDEYAGEHGEYHMFLMSVCKNFIIPNSTFSWWGAWLALNLDKIVVAPKQWFRDNSIDTSDLIPDNWVRI
jgi:hypothetical protein